MRIADCGLQSKKSKLIKSSVVNLTFLNSGLRTVIPAPYEVRGKLQRESRRRPCESRDLYQRNWVPVCTGNPGFPCIKYGAGLSSPE